MATADAKQLRAVSRKDFDDAMQVIRRSVARETLGAYEQWNNEYGSSGA